MSVRLRRPKHAIKLRRARSLARIGGYPLTWHTIIGVMPRELISECTARQIALIADLVRAQHSLGHSAGYADATD